jgi:hypothetical protein
MERDPLSIILRISECGCVVGIGTVTVVFLVWIRSLMPNKKDKTINRMLDAARKKK